MKRIASTCRTLLPVLVALTAAGCLPRQLVVWSPNGARAVVMHANSTSLCDGEGKLAATDIGAAQAAAWTPDSRHVLLAVQKSAAKWAELAPVLDETTRQAAIAAADALEKAVLAVPGSEELTDEQAKEIAKKVFDGRNSLAPAATVYLRDVRPDAVRRRLGEKWEELEDKMSVAYTRLGLYELDGMSLKAGPAVLHSLRAVNELRLAPDGKAVAYVTGSDRTESSFTLWLAPTTPNAAPRELADRVAIFPDFSADSQRVAFLQSAGTDEGKPLAVGRLATRQVADANGAPLADLPDAEDLATIVFDNTATVRCLADGRILFVSGDVNLPAPTAEMRGSRSLFSFTPGESAKVARIIPRDSKVQLPDDMLFDLSPDQKHVSVVGDGAKVCVVTLADGQIAWVLGEESKKGKLRMLPSWRRSGQLCFMIPEEAADTGRNEVALWSAGKTTILSKDWPDEVLENLTFAPAPPKKPTTAPATAPTTGPGKGF